jgi:hypothetical protein
MILHEGVYGSVQSLGATGPVTQARFRDRLEPVNARFGSTDESRLVA